MSVEQRLTRLERLMRRLGEAIAAELAEEDEQPEIGQIGKSPAARWPDDGACEEGKLLEDQTTLCWGAGGSAVAAISAAALT